MTEPKAQKCAFFVTLRDEVPKGLSLKNLFGEKKARFFTFGSGSE